MKVIVWFELSWFVWGWLEYYYLLLCRVVIDREFRICLWCSWGWSFVYWNVCVIGRFFRREFGGIYIGVI